MGIGYYNVIEVGKEMVCGVWIGEWFEIEGWNMLFFEKGRFLCLVEMLVKVEKNVGKVLKIKCFFFLYFFIGEISIVLVVSWDFGNFCCVVEG